MASNVPRGRFCWYDLMTPDPDAAVDFYTKVVGWKTAAWEGGPMPYTMWNTEKGSIGGVMQLPDEAKAAGAPPHWLAYVSVPDVDETATQATKLGGSVIKEAMDIPDVGRIAVLADPQGAVFAVYKPASETPGHDGPREMGEISWHELATTNHEAAWDYYSALFEWEKAEAMDMGEMGTYQMYGRKGVPQGGLFNKPAEMPGPPFWLYYAKVGDVHQVVERVKELGGRILNGPMEVPGGDWIAQCMDPQGAAFAIHSAKKQ